MKYTVSSKSPIRMCLDVTDETDNIIQNIALLLSTAKGSIPMYRNFGVDMSYMSRPFKIAEAMATKEAMAAIDQFEPRAKLLELRLCKGSKPDTYDMEVDIEI